MVQSAMNVYLAEGGNAWKSYFREWGACDDLFLAGSEFLKSYIGVETNANIPCQATSRGKMSSATSPFSGANILQSFYYADDFTVNEILPNCKRFLLDSGAFTFFAKGGGSDWNDYTKRYAEFISRNKIERFFELDIDSLIGYEKVLDMRYRLEDLTGKPCIPVWHKSRGKDEFLKMCEEYDYVAIGGLVTKEIAAETIISIAPWFIREAHKQGAKIHGLGFTGMKALEKCHFDSVDSTAWIAGNKYGAIYQFDGRKIITHDKQPGKRLADAKRVALHNWNEWRKFCKYAEAKL